MRKAKRVLTLLLLAASFVVLNGCDDLIGPDSDSDSDAAATTAGG